MELIQVPDRAALARHAAERFASLAQQAVATHGRFSVALSGGSTPRDLYRLLASPEFVSRIPWTQMHIFWGDERGVPPEDPESNYRMAYASLLSRVPIPAANVHRILAERGAEKAAEDYARTLREWFNPKGETWPCFDLILLGLGENGHTASLFPHTPVLHESKRWVIGYYVDEVKLDRITLTAPLINAAENILFLVSGEEKAATVRAVLREVYRPDDLPAQLIQPTTGHLVWLLDSAAAAYL